MSARIRYSHPQIVSHLASHYVLGQQTERVRRYTQQLRLTHPELDKAILAWQAHFSHLDELTPAIEPPSHLWKSIETSLFADSKSLTAEDFPTAKTPWYQIPYLWLGMSLSSALTAVLMLALLLPFMSAPDTKSAKSIGYLAVMSATETQATANTRTDENIHFVLAAYKGDKAGQSTLQIQWKSGLDKVDTSTWQLASVARESGAITELGSMTDIIGRHLTGREWQAIKNSQSLQIKRGDQVIFEGPCLQLTDWAKKQT
ncbi:hypothetical protein CBF23_003950 [Marinomonas agarivorans]|nr:hypothetical protein CBF23_003950 [Marinomonas agarivorans]